MIANNAAATWVRQWSLWRLPPAARWYISAVAVAGVTALTAAAATTRWRLDDIVLCLVLMGCGALTIEASRLVREPQGTLFWDMMPVWYQTIAVILSPFYALLAPVCAIALKQWRVMRSPWHRRVLSAAAVAMPYGSISLIFHAIPWTATGPVAGGGASHAVAWAATATACGLAAMILNDSLVVFAILLADPNARLKTMLTGREALSSNVVQLGLGSLIAFAVAASPFLMLLALPSVLLQRRYLMHTQLLAAARTDPKTGLLNSAAWERQAETELSRARRSGAPLVVAIADIDHFKQVNDTWDHLAGDRVLRAIASTLTSTLRDYDLCGRFGGEEFAIALPDTTLADAADIAERVRNEIESLVVPVSDSPDATQISVTISIGVAAFAPEADDEAQDLTTLMAAADHALYQAKQAGRNRVHTVRLGWR